MHISAALEAVSRRKEEARETAAVRYVKKEVQMQPKVDGVQAWSLISLEPKMKSQARGSPIARAHWQV